tara:strand:- start:2320 stop:3048 length:729 start_codon:yes stop_codon:yes gene_type:complete
MISEQDNTPEEVKSRVTQMTKAVRYKARKEGGNLFKAFNDYMGSQSGISATERASVKQRLGLSEKYSSWRDELQLREIASEPVTDKEMDKTIKEKKVKNKITINPTLGEAIEEMGGTILEAVEVEVEEIEEELTPEKKKQLQLKGQMMKKQQLLDRQRLQAQKSGRLPMGTGMKEESELEEKVLDKAETDEKERIVKGMKKNFTNFKDKYGKEAKSVMYATATKMAKKHMDTSKSDRRYGVE